MDATFLPGNEENNNKNTSNTALCRQTTTRWTPTTEQIRILKDLYYNTGIRSPSAEQIQKISAKLRHYGKIEGKNVFYWFQNHKARERQKKRLITTTTTTHDHRPPTSALWRSEDHSAFYNKCPNFTSPSAAGAPSASSFSPGGMIHADGQFGKFANYGSFAHVENGFWGGGHGGGGGGGIHNLGWTAVGVDPYYNQYYPSAAYNFLDKNTLDEEQEQEEEDQEESGGGLMETLPLFPIHGEEVSGGFWKQESVGSGNYNNNNNWYMQSDNGGGNMSCSRASLELTLNSYGCSNWSG